MSNDKKNLKTVLCNNIIKGETCIYGVNCDYAHSLSEQHIDKVRHTIYTIIKNNTTLENINLLEDNKLFRGLIVMTKICSFCVRKKCLGGYNCRNGAINVESRICYDDLMNGQCRRPGCVSIHLTKRGLIPYYQQQINKLNNYAQKEPIDNFMNPCLYPPLPNSSQQNKTGYEDTKNFTTSWGDHTQKNKICYNNTYDNSENFQPVQYATQNNYPPGLFGWEKTDALICQNENTIPINAIGSINFFNPNGQTLIDRDERTMIDSELINNNIGWNKPNFLTNQEFQPITNYIPLSQSVQNNIKPTYVLTNDPIKSNNIYNNNKNIWGEKRVIEQPKINEITTNKFNDSQQNLQTNTYNIKKNKLKELKNIKGILLTDQYFATSFDNKNEKLNNSTESEPEQDNIEEIIKYLNSDSDSESYDMNNKKINMDSFEESIFDE